MRLAVLSDLHANLPALEAVAKDLREQAPDAVVCLGDLVGYNAEPKETIELLRTLTDRILLGNHDRDAARASAGPGTHAAARQVQSWTHDHLPPAELEFLRALPAIIVEPAAFVAVHGCYLNDSHYNGYVTGTMLEANLAAIALRTDWPRLALCGHTHAPMCGFQKGGTVTEVALRDRAEWPASSEAVLVNPGAVGQPRDGDPRACYAVLDLDRHAVALRRVAYDVERTIRAIVREGLPPELGDRLRTGR